MKFEHKYPDASIFDKFEFEDHSYVIKSKKLGKCKYCNAYTKWFDVKTDFNVCSEECNSSIWSKIKKIELDTVKRSEELLLPEGVNDWKDILIVVKDQLSYFEECIESLMHHTNNYHLYIWDNGSKSNVDDYIQKLISKCDLENDNWKITTIRSETNTGFIYPNNELVAIGESPYIILLNSDTRVFKNWDTTMIGFLKNNPDVAQVGYWGGYLGPDGKGFGGSNGWDVDYIPGWCFCINRQTYDQFGLFSDKLRFAYCEDSDFSLRLKESGKKIYALHSLLVHHHENKTVEEVRKEGIIDMRLTFEGNHAYMRDRWKDYLSNKRILLNESSK